MRALFNNEKKPVNSELLQGRQNVLVLFIFPFMAPISSKLGIEQGLEEFLLSK